MSTIARFERPGLLERLTNSTAFAVLFGMASLVLAPSVLIGLFVLPALFVPAAQSELGCVDVAAPLGGTASSSLCRALPRAATVLVVCERAIA